MQQLMGPLPVTDWSLERKPESYLPWLHLILLDFLFPKGELGTAAGH